MLYLPIVLLCSITKIISERIRGQKLERNKNTPPDLITPNDCFWLGLNETYIPWFDSHKPNFILLSYESSITYHNRRPKWKFYLFILRLVGRPSLPFLLRALC